MIAKNEARKHQEQQREAEAKALETRIDVAIQGNTSGSVYVDIAGVSSVAVDMVKKKYEDGGWSVSVVHDQRDGSSISLR